MDRNVEEERAKVVKRIVILLIVLSFLIVPVAAQEQDVYQLILKYDKEIITKEQLRVTKGFFYEVQTQPERAYRIEVVSFDGDILHKRNFEFPLEIAFDSHEVVEEGLTQMLDSATVELLFPYFTNGKTINIYDPDNTKVLEIDIGYFAKVCGDNQCQPHESNADCPQDCPSGQKDDFCDKIAEGICDPDCLVGDIDCPGQEAKGIVKQPEDVPGEPPQDILPTFPILQIIILAIVLGLLLLYVKIKAKPKEKKQEEAKEIQLKTYIMKNLRSGYTAQQIRQNLIKTGQNKEIIDKAFAEIAGKPTKKQQKSSEIMGLERYISANLQKGYTEEQIKEGLLKQGHKKRIIEKAFKKLKK